MFTKLHPLIREFRDLLWILIIAPPNRREVVIYSRENSSYAHFEGIITELTERYGCHVTYVTSDPQDPLFRQADRKFTLLYIRNLLTVFMKALDAQVLLLTMPDLGKFHVPRPPKKTRPVYIFHAILSTHMVYRLGAFDHYDTIFCVGPHHNHEITRHSEVYGVPQRTLVNFGYPKLDQLAESCRQYTKRCTDATTVLVAPGWGDSNILTDLGDVVISKLLDAGYQVIVRPHPELVRRSPHVLRKLVSLFGKNPQFTLEPNIISVESLLEADVMICDWSGVAFEYAFATERPVLSIDLPRKVRNPEWERLGIVPFEDFARRAIGPVIGVDELANLGDHVAQILAQPEAYRASIQELRSKYIYNFGHSSQVGARYIYHLIRCSGETAEKKA
jgi:YidC/Oxa1 family membrane protein insertase